MHLTYTELHNGQLLLQDGSTFAGRVFGFPQSMAGEVVFNTGMVGYPESLTDPSYKGQILVFTYPLIGNYGVPDDRTSSDLSVAFESEKIQVTGLIVADVSTQHNHWNAVSGLPHWLAEQRVPALSGIDVRALTKLLREKGSLLGKISVGEERVEFR